MKRYVIGDIHGNHKGLLQVLEQSNFDYENDLLIVLGDICDSWSDVKECFDEILKIKNTIRILGNHDEWAYYYYTDKEHYHFKKDTSKWMQHGGKATLLSFGRKMEQKYIDYLESCVSYHILDDNKIFAHGSIPNKLMVLEKAHPMYFLWNRDLLEKAYYKRDWEVDLPGETADDRWNEIYLGHSIVSNYDDGVTTPQKWLNVWAMDTGSGFNGKLSMMDIDTKEVFQSERSMILYPTQEGRNKYCYNYYIKNNIKPF